MKLPRNVRIFRGQLDVAPFATVFLLLILFLMLGGLAYTPGVHINLPETDILPGTDKPAISVAVDQSGRYYYENHWIDEKSLAAEFRKAKAKVGGPLVLVINADKTVTCDTFVRLTMMARKAGINESLLSTLPATEKRIAVAP